MKELDVEGLFWRPERQDRKMAGRLRFSPSDGAVLSIVEHSLNLDSFGIRLDDEAVRLVGVAGSHTLTLDQCSLFEVSREYSGMVQRRYQVDTILSGAHFGRDEPLSFSAVTVQLSNLVQWVGRSGLSVDRSPVGDSAKAEGKIRIDSALVAPIEVDTSDGSIAVTFPRRWKTNQFESMVEHKCSLNYRFREPRSLATIMQVCSALRNLVTICAHASSVVLDTKLNHSDLERPISLYTNWIGTNFPKELDTVHQSKMPLTFDDIGGVEGIRAWLDVASSYSALITLLVSHWYVPPLYQEQRYFNAVVAAETLIRIRKEQQHINLKEELHDLARELGSLFEPLVGDCLEWTREVVRTRDNFVVHPGLQGNRDGYRLYMLSESIYVLVVLALLRECGVSIDSLKNIQDHEHYTWLAGKLCASV